MQLLREAIMRNSENRALKLFSSFEKFYEFESTVWNWNKYHYIVCIVDNAYHGIIYVHKNWLFSSAWTLTRWFYISYFIIGISLLYFIRTIFEIATIFKLRTMDCYNGTYIERYSFLLRTLYLWHDSPYTTVGKDDKKAQEDDRNPEGENSFIRSPYVS